MLGRVRRGEAILNKSKQGIERTWEDGREGGEREKGVGKANYKSFQAQGIVAVLERCSPSRPSSAAIEDQGAE